MRLYKCWFAGGLMFEPTNRKTYTFRAYEEYQPYDRVLVEANNGLSVVIVAEETSVEDLTFDKRFLKPIFGKVNMDAYLGAKRPRKEHKPKWYREKLEAELS